MEIMLPVSSAGDCRDVLYICVVYFDSPQSGKW